MKRIAVPFANECPICHGKCGVRNTSHDEEDPGLIRNRKCKSCGHKFTTIEIEMGDLWNLIDSGKKTRDDIISDVVLYLERMREKRE
jgi:hypothetical protein